LGPIRGMPHPVRPSHKIHTKTAAHSRFFRLPRLSYSMKLLRPLAIAYLATTWIGSVSAAEPHLGGDGIDIDAGSLGKFTIEYPQLLDGSQKPVHKLLEKKTTGKAATLKYDDGTELDVSVGNGGKVEMRFPHPPADVKNIDFEMHIPIAFNQGGKWHIGDKEADFPVTKPASPHLFQGHAPALRIQNFEGKILEVKVPENSFLQLTDNREWNWGIFHWKSLTPFDPNRPEFALIISTSTATSGKAQPLVDQFGQSTRADWPDKVKSLEELKADADAEKAYYANLHPPEFDAFGGLPKSGETLGLKTTGFFHVEKKSDRWFLVDPAGNAFFHFGLCGMNPGDDFTLVKGRESAFAWLPTRGSEFDSGFKADANGTVVSFHLANMIRKYGQPYNLEEYSARMIERVRKWGFNSGGAFSGIGAKARNTAQFPFVSHLPLAEWEGIPRLPSIGETFDPFDEKTRARIDANFAKSLPAQANDPLIIGHFITNEPTYENIAHMVPALNANYACKLKFVQWLSDKYKTITAYNAAWEAQAGSFDELKDRVLNVKSQAAKDDAHAFAGVFLDEYFHLVSDTYRRYDTHHLLLGSRLQPGTINDEQLCRICGKYLDVMSFNYYTVGVDKEFLQRIYRWTGGLPMMLSEFYWSAPKESGLAGGSELATQQERGLAYRNYVEQSASLGFVIGIEWFTLVDQAATGRWFSGFDGERANTGIIAVTDRPWKGMLNEATKTNYDIYKVLLGERPPFVFGDPRFQKKK